MKGFRFIHFLFTFLLFLNFSIYSQESNLNKPKIILFVTEQNIEGPQRAWWASEIDLSIIEAKIASILIEKGYKVIEPSLLRGLIKKEPAFRIVDLSEEKAIELAKLSEADYIVLGKAIASSGSNIAGSNMRSCYANVSVKLIRVKNKEVIAFLDASGSSIHLDLITGGKEALSKAGSTLALKILEILNQERS